MGGSADFTAYVVARWATLVRTLILLGHSPSQADALAADALSRCRSGFERERREGDVDVWVYRTLLETRRRSRDAVSQAPIGAEAVVATSLIDLEDRSARLAELETSLEAMPEEERAATVLRLVAELDEIQVGQVLGHVSGAGDLDDADTRREATEAIPVRDAPLAEIAGRARSRRSRRLRWAAAVTVGLVVAAAVATWVGTRESGQEPSEPVVTAEENPADIAWYANRTLHLAHVTVELPQLRSMVQVPDGVVYADWKGVVAEVDGEGTVSTLGSTAEGTSLVGSSERGWVAWVDDRDPDGRLQLVVHDTLGDRELDRRDAAPDLRPVALDQDRVYFMQDGRPWSWRFDAGEQPGPEPGRQLWDVASRVRASEASASAVLVSQPLFNIQVTVPGEEAQLSPDGAFVLTRVNVNAPQEVRIYRAANGAVVPSGLDQEEMALAASLGPAHTVTYVVALRAHAPAGDDFLRLSESGVQLLRTCDLDTATCSTVTQLAAGRGTPVLPD